MTKDNFGFVPDEEDFGFQPDDVSVTTLPQENELEQALKEEKTQKEIELRSQFLQKVMTQVNDADPKNWTHKRLTDHFKKNPAKDPQEEAQRAKMLEEKKAVEGANKEIIWNTLKGTLADITAIPWRALGMRAPVEGEFFKDHKSAAEWLSEPVGTKEEAVKWDEKKGWQYKDREVPRWEQAIENGVSLATFGIVGYVGLQSVLQTPQAQILLSKISTKNVLERVPKDKLFELLRKLTTQAPETLTQEETNIYNSFNKEINQIASAFKQGFKESAVPRKGFEWLAEMLGVTPKVPLAAGSAGASKDLVFMHAGVPVPKSGEVVNFAGQAYKVLSVTGNTAMLLSNSGEKIQAALDQLQIGIPAPTEELAINVTPEQPVAEETPPQEDLLAKGREEDILGQYDTLSEVDRAKLDLELDDLRKTPEGNLFVAIKQLGGIRPYTSTGAKAGTKFLAEELKSIPFHLKNKDAANTLDTIVSELASSGWVFESSDDLLAAIKHQADNPIQKVDRAGLRTLLKEAEKNEKLQQKIEDSFKKRRKFITTVKEAEKTAPEVAKKIESLYTPITNAETLKQAQEYVTSNYNKAVELAEGPSRANTFSNTVAIVLTDKAQAEGRWADAIRLVEKTAKKNTELGQAIQALAMYERLTPEGILKYAEKVVRQARESIGQKERLTNFERISKTLDNQADKDKLAEKLGIPHISEVVAGELRRMAETIQTMPPGRDKQIEEALLLKKIADQIPPGLGKKIAMIQTMAQLLNPKTFIRNILGNVGFQALEGVSDTVGTALDIAASLATGKRTAYLPNIPLQAKGLAQGMKEGTQEALLGINLKPGQQSKYSLPSNGVFDKGVMGALEKTLRVTLSATDRAFYQAAFNQSLRNQTLAAKIEEPTAEMIERAHYEGLYRTFQDDNVISRLFVNLKRTLNLEKDFGLGDIIIKYPKTPANILARGIEYSPFSFIKSIMILSKPLFGREFNQEDFVKSTSRGFTGSALLVGVGALLASLGIISGKRAKDKDVAATRENVGIREYQINVSALKRFIASGMDPDMAKLQEGDMLATYDWMLPSSIGLALGANMVIDGKENITDKVLNLGDRVLQASETLAEQPLVQGLRVLTSRQNIAEGIGEAAKGIPASFMPTLLNQIRQLTDNTSRNTKDPNYFKEAYNKSIMRIPGASSTLEPKVTPLGEPKQMYQLDSNNPFNVFLNPAFVNTYRPDEVSKMVLEIWETTGETIHFPRVAQAKIKLGSDTKEPVELSASQYTEYQKYIGNKTDILFTILSDNKKFMALPDEVKAKKLQGYLTDINTAAKIEILGYRPKNVSQDVITILKYIGENKRQIEAQDEEDFGFEEDDLGFVPEE